MLPVPLGAQARRRLPGFHFKWLAAAVIMMGFAGGPLAAGRGCRAMVARACRAMNLIKNNLQVSS